MAAKRRDSRFGFGQLVGTAGVVLLTVGVSQPWLKVNLATAFADALKTNTLPTQLSGQILFVASNGEGPKQPADSPAVVRLLQQLGVEPTGWAQDRYLAAAVLAAALIALIGVLRSVLASSAYGARRNSPLLATAGLGALIVAGVELWVLAPDPRTAMRPDVGLFLITGGAVCLLLGALTLGNNRRRPFMDDLDEGLPMKSFDNTEHLAYSHGAWVPRSPGDER